VPFIGVLGRTFEIETGALLPHCDDAPGDISSPESLCRRRAHLPNSGRFQFTAEGLKVIVPG